METATFFPGSMVLSVYWQLFHVFSFPSIYLSFLFLCCSLPEDRVHMPLILAREYILSSADFQLGALYFLYSFIYLCK